MACGLALTIAQARGEADRAPEESAASPLVDALGLSGTVRAADFTRDRSSSTRTGYTVGSIWATATPQELWGVRSYFDIRAQAQDLTRSSRVSWDVREGYARFRVGHLDLRAGRQVTVWGRADKVNPTDAWSTRDLTLLAPNDDDQRLGVASMQTSWNAGAYRTILLWQPEWRYPVLPIPQLPSGLSVHNLAPANPSHQFGVKLDHSGEGMDWSLSYSHSISRTPDLTALAVGPQGYRLGLVYPMVGIVGADAAVPVGKFGLRGEVAYTRPLGRNGTDPLAQKRNVFAVLGCERTFEGVLNINAQYLYRRTFEFVSSSAIADPNTRFLAEQADLLGNRLAPDMHAPPEPRSHFSDSSASTAPSTPFALATRRTRVIANICATLRYAKFGELTNIAISASLTIVGVGETRERRVEDGGDNFNS